MDLQIELAESVKEARRFWPSPQDYNEALQNPETSFADQELRSGSAQLDSLGLPRPTSGAFASVYKLQSGEKTLAVRCFLNNTRDQERRYELLSAFVMSDDLPYTVSFEYQPRGIFIRGEWFPILKMDWVEGLTLERYIAAHINDRSALRMLRDRFKEMCLHLSAAGVAHGDLQHGNILVTASGELRLVDYDGMFVPRMTGWRSNELGHRNFQHPKRDATHFGPFLDSFASWSIYTSLTALIEEPGFFNLAPAGDDCLIFRREDYENWVTSSVVKRLVERKPSELTQCMGCLLWHVQAEPWQHLPLTTTLNEQMILETKNAVARFAPVPGQPGPSAELSAEDQQTGMASETSEQVLFDHPVRRVETKYPGYSTDSPSPQDGMKLALGISLVFGLIGFVMNPFWGLLFFALSFSYFAKYIFAGQLVTQDSPDLIAKGNVCEGSIINATYNKDGAPVVRYKFFVRLPYGAPLERIDSVIVSQEQWNIARPGDKLVVLHMTERRKWCLGEVSSHASVPYQYAKFRALPPLPDP